MTCWRVLVAAVFMSALVAPVEGQVLFGTDAPQHLAEQRGEGENAANPAAMQAALRPVCHNGPSYDADTFGHGVSRGPMARSSEEHPLNAWWLGGQSVLRPAHLEATRGLWKITKKGTERVLEHSRFGKFFKNKSDGLWWSVDRTGHGGSKWKVFKETSEGLRWTADADEFGDFIVGKHKSPVGQEIPWSELGGR